jgi:hypothetical protein
LDEAETQALVTAASLDDVQDSIDRLHDKTITVTVITNYEGAFFDPDTVGGSPRQHGGVVHSGRAYPVGEAGPELFVPAVNGRIIPHGMSPAPATTATPVQQTNNYTFVSQTRESMALALATVHERRRQSLSQFMGV